MIKDIANSITKEAMRRCDNTRCKECKYIELDTCGIHLENEILEEVKEYLKARKW